MKLREYRFEDWNDVAKLFYNTIHSINSVNYTDEQLDAWAPKNMELPELKNRLLTNYAVVAEDNGIIIGFGNVSGTGYFDCIYTHKDYQRKGVATLIADDIEKYFHNQGVQVISTDSSITAKPFFKNRGYRTLQKQSVEHRGLFFINFKMQKLF